MPYALPVGRSALVQSLTVHSVLCSVLPTHLHVLALSAFAYVPHVLCRVPVVQPRRMGMVLCTMGGPLFCLSPHICLPFVPSAPCFPYHCLQGGGGRGQS